MTAKKVAIVSNQTRFYYRIVIEPAWNPPGTYDRVHEELRAWVTERGFGNGMGALGGSRVLYCEIGSKPRAIEDDRQALAAWVRECHMSATVQIGPLHTGEIGLLDPVTDIDFDVNALTAEERITAAEQYEKGRRRVEALRQKMD